MVGMHGLKKQTLLNEKRFKGLMNDIKTDVVRTTENSATLDAWIAKLGGHVIQNTFTTGKSAVKVNKIVNDITNSTKYSALPKGGMSEVVKGVISENTMHYVTKMGDDLKTDLRKIAVESYNQHLAPRDIAKQMASKIDGMSNTRAQLIARTETMRASNLANYANAKYNMNAQSFTVNSDPDCCPLCDETYGHGSITFDITQNDMIPPLHPRCECVALFSTRHADGSSQYDDVPTSNDMGDLADSVAMYGYASMAEFNNAYAGYSGIGTAKFSELWDQVQNEMASFKT